MSIVRFECYELDAAAGQLRRRGTKLRLRDQPLQVLATLVEHSGEVVTREELQRLLWPNDVEVDFENNLNTAIARIRDALGDSAKNPRFIETLPRRGYRFIAKPVSASIPVKRRLLVLPFANASGDPSQEYFADAMTGEIIAELSGYAPQQLAVIARATAMHCKGTKKDPTRIARELSVDYLVEGSVGRHEQTVALRVRVTRVPDETEIFSKRYDFELGDIFEIQRGVAHAVGRALATEPGWPAPPSAPDLRFRRRPTADLTAYNSYILGRYHLDKGESPATWKLAREFLENAIARDPNFALAYDALAELWWYVGFLGAVPPKESLPVGMVHAMRALEIDGSVAEAHAMLAQYRKQLAYNWLEVEREMALAVELDPTSPIVRTRRAVTGLMPLGRIDEAIADCERAPEVDPLAAHPRVWLAVMLWLGRHHERALEQGRLALDIAPSHVTGHIVVGVAYLGTGQPDKAIATHREMVEFTHGAPVTLGWLGLTLADCGDRAGARQVLDRLRAMPAEVWVPPSSLAWVQVGLGDYDGFFESMNRAVEERDHMIMPIKTYPFMDRVRDDPRFVPLLRKMNLA